MKKRTREKVALLVFVLLVVLGGSVLLRYFETGRSFNMAATAVDDAFGQMSGYTAIVFDGTYDVLDALRPTKLPSVDGDADERPETLGEMVAAELARLPLSMRERPVYASDVRSFYEEKGAGVLTLNLDDLARYEKPRILMAGDRKIGVVAVDYYASARQLEKLHDELASAGAESNVVIVTDDDQAEPGRGEGEGNAHIVYAPERGQVGVVLLTSLNVPSSKVCASL